MLVQQGKYNYLMNCSIPVNYNVRLSEAIQVGGYDVVCQNIREEKFPLQAGETGLKYLVPGIFQFDTQLSLEEIISAMDQEYYRPATLRELLSFDRNSKCSQIKDEIHLVALGQSYTTVKPLRFVPILGRDREDENKVTLGVREVTLLESRFGFLGFVTLDALRALRDSASAL